MNFPFILNLPLEHILFAKSNATGWKVGGSLFLFSSSE
jgi:hypothetical protein